jgi:hypothetical protein
MKIGGLDGFVSQFHKIYPIFHFFTFLVMHPVEIAHIVIASLCCGICCILAMTQRKPKPLPVMLDFGSTRPELVPMAKSPSTRESWSTQNSVYSNDSFGTDFVKTKQEKMRDRDIPNCESVSWGEYRIYGRATDGAPELHI